MQVELRDSLEFLFSDSEVSRRPRRKIELDVARGGTIAVNVLTAGMPEQGVVTLSVRQNGAPVRSAHWFRLHHVSVEKNTGPDGFDLKEGKSNPHVIRRAPFRVYDAMEPIGKSVESGGGVALRLHIPVGRDERPGRRELAIELVCGSQRIELLVLARMHKAVMAPSGRGSLPYTNWFSFENMASRHGLKMWSESHWRMIRQYARLMAHARQNMFLVPLGNVFRRAARGHVLDRERLERLVKLFTDEGLWFIEGGHLGQRHKGEWNAEYFDLVLDGPRATSPEGNAEIARLSHQLMQVIRENKWHRRWIQHVTDEPTAENAVDYRIFVGMAHESLSQ